MCNRLQLFSHFNQTIFIMKKKLLYLTSIVLFAASSINAQTSKVWDMSQFSTQTFAVTTNVVVDRLGMYPGSGVTTFGVVATSSTAFTASPDAFSGTYTLKAGGNGISSISSWFIFIFRS